MQQLHHNPELTPYFYECCLRSGEPNLRSLALAKRLFETTINTQKKQLLVIDGLDEYAQFERKEILDYLVRLVYLRDEQEPGSLRMLVVSRDEPDIRISVHSLAVSTSLPRIITLSSADMEKDIRIYLNTWSSRIQQKYSILTDDQVQYIRNVVMGKSEGT
jgi:hypothetical protein